MVPRACWEVPHYYRAPPQRIEAVFRDLVLNFLRWFGPSRVCGGFVLAFRAYGGIASSVFSFAYGVGHYSEKR